MAVRLSVNGETREFSNHLTVEGLLGVLSLDPRKVAVERNLAIVPRSAYAQVSLADGDRLEIVVKLHRPVVYRNPGVFDYRRHLERQGVYWTGTIRNPRLITVLDRGWHGKDRIKNWIQTRLEAPFAADRSGHQVQAGSIRHVPGYAR